VSKSVIQRRKPAQSGRERLAPPVREKWVGARNPGYQANSKPDRFRRVTLDAAAQRSQAKPQPVSRGRAPMAAGRQLAE
jgi:hypothetical protein